MQWRQLPSLIAPPAKAEDYAAWLLDLKRKREQCKLDLQIHAAPVSNEKLEWVKGCFVCAKWMTWDRRFLDPVKGEFRVDKFLEDGNERFGGYDAVVLWQAYPRIGFDDRNQFDFYRELPGGLKAVKSLVDRLHRGKVKVFIDYNPWDTGTRREAKGDGDSLRELADAIGADGVFLDTLHQGDDALRAGLLNEKRPLALESELDLPPTALADHSLSWLQWPNPPELVGLMRNHWLSPDHMQHVIRRWHRSHRHEMYLAWLNGAGMLVWENVFGSWNGWSAADAITLRRMRACWNEYKDFFTDGERRPFIPISTNGLLASQFQLMNELLWTIVNPTDKRVTAKLPLENVFDAFSGNQQPLGEIELPPFAVGAVSTRRKELRVPARDPMPAIQIRPVAIVAAELSSVPFGMTEVRFGGGKVIARIRYRECGAYGHANFETAGSPKLHQIVTIESEVAAKAFAIDTEEVTNAQFEEFLRATKYKPKQDENFLKHWTNKKPTPGTENQPVTFIDLDDARAFAKWKGKRLPTDWEWQIAAQAGKISRGSPLVWNMTESEHTDGITDFFMLKGGCEKKVTGSDWYGDGGHQEPDFIAKFIRIWPGLDRCSTIGFRCAGDLQINLKSLMTPMLTSLT